MLLQLDPPLPLITPLGKAIAHIVIDYGPEHDLLWVCAQDETGECWTWSNTQVRFQMNVTMGRKTITLITPTVREEEVKPPRKEHASPRPSGKRNA